MSDRSREGGRGERADRRSSRRRAGRPEYAFDLELCAALERERRAIVARQLGSGVHRPGGRVLDVVLIEPGPKFDERAALTPECVPESAIASDVGPGRFRPVTDAIDAAPERARAVAERAAEVGFFELDRRDGARCARQVARYPSDWFGSIVGVENKPDLSTPGALADQLRTDVCLGVVDRVVLATESHVTGAHLNRIPDPVGVWRVHDGPADGGSDPGEVSSEPDDASFDPDDATSDPGDAGFDPGDASFDPDDATSDLGDAGFDPGDASSGPDDADRGRVDSGRIEVVREPEPLPVGDWGTELLERRPGGADVAFASPAEKTQARRRLAERAYGKGWRSAELPGCAKLAPDARSGAQHGSACLPHCTWAGRVVDAGSECGPDCPGFEPAEPPTIDPATKRAERTPWRADPEGRQRRQAGLDRFGDE